MADVVSFASIETKNFYGGLISRGVTYKQDFHYNYDLRQKYGIRHGRIFRHPTNKDNPYDYLYLYCRYWQPGKIKIQNFTLIN